MRWYSASAYGRSTKFSTWNSLRQLTAFRVREHVSSTKGCFRVRCSSSENAHNSESRGIDGRDRTFARKPGIGYRPGLADTNGETFAESDEREKIRFYAPRTNTRQKGLNVIVDLSERRRVRLGFRRALVVKCGRLDGRVPYFRKGRRGV